MIHISRFLAKLIQIYSAQRSSGSRPLNINQQNGMYVWVEQNFTFNAALFAVNLVSRAEE